MRRRGAGVLVAFVCAIALLCGQVFAQQQPEGKLTFQELQQDINTLGIINYMNPTVQQMQKMVQIISEYRKVADAPPPQELLSALEKTRELLIKGASRMQAEQQTGLAAALAAYTRKIDAARKKASDALVALLSEEQKQALATLRTPYQYFQQLVWEIGASRAMSDEQWKKWADGMVKRLSTSRRGQPLMSAEEARQYLQRVRGMNDEQWNQEAAALYQRLIGRLPARVRQMLDSPRAVQQRVRRALQALLDNPRTPELLQACIKADQAGQG